MPTAEIDVYKDRNLAIAMEKAASGDLVALTPDERVAYYLAVCRSVGLNEMTKPFIFLKTTVKEGNQYVSRVVLYPTKECGEQLREKHLVSIYNIKKELIQDGAILQLSAEATNRAGKHDEETALVPLAGLSAVDYCNAVMKGVTKLKRRLTLSICGLGWANDSPDQPVGEEIPLLIDGETKLLTDDLPPNADLPPDLADIHDPAKDDAAYTARAALIRTIRDWAMSQDMAWPPVKHIFDAVITELEAKHGPMNDTRWRQLNCDGWLCVLYQKVIDGYEKVAIKLAQRPASPDVTLTEEHQGKVDAWEAMFNPAK